MTDVFLSYARMDANEAERLVRALKDSGFSVWWDPELVPGEIWDESIQTALRAASAVVVVWSQDSVGRPWVKAEAGDALERGTLVPVLLEPVEVPLQFRHVQTADLRGWDGEPNDPRFLQLVESIARKVQGVKARPSRVSTQAPVQLTDPGARKRGHVVLPLWLLVLSVVGLAGAGGAAWMSNGGAGGTAGAGGTWIDNSGGSKLGGGGTAAPSEGGSGAQGQGGAAHPTSTAPGLGERCASSKPRCATELLCTRGGTCQREGQECGARRPGSCAAPRYRRVGDVLECSSDAAPLPEICDCVDNDCDGSVDEGLSCPCTASGAKGVCAAGVRSCEGTTARCAPSSPSAELCKNHADDDCDGLVDEGCIHVVKARLGCLDLQTAGNITSLVKERCDGLQRCAFKAPSEAEYRALGIRAATRTFCTQGMEISFHCGSTDLSVVNVPGDAWNHGPAKLVCP
jgi:hypothetical protein